MHWLFYAQTLLTLSEERGSQRQNGNHFQEGRKTNNRDNQRGVCLMSAVTRIFPSYWDRMLLQQTQFLLCYLLQPIQSCAETSTASLSICNINSRFPSLQILFEMWWAFTTLWFAFRFCYNSNLHFIILTYPFVCVLPLSTDTLII